MLEEIRVLWWGIYSDSTLKGPPLEKRNTLGNLYSFISLSPPAESYTPLATIPRPSEQSQPQLAFFSLVPQPLLHLSSAQTQGADSLFVELPFHHPSSSHRHHMHIIDQSTSSIGRFGALQGALSLGCRGFSFTGEGHPPLQTKRKERGLGTAGK